MSECTHTLAVDEDGQMVCLVCAHEHALSSYPHLYWMANRPREVSADVICSQCDQSCARPDVEDVADEIAKFLHSRV